MNPQAATEVISKLTPDLADAPYLLHVGGYWYKNREGVCAVFGELLRGYPDLRLVLVGHLEAAAQDFLKANPQLQDVVVHLEGVKVEDLRALYCRAEVLLFPSWWEGFGWPVLEALACGCPVITTNRSPMSEVGGQAVTYIPPCPTSKDERQQWILATAMSVRNVLERDIELRELWRQEGIKQAASFGLEAWRDRLVETLTGELEV
jgi:glycosyltransferase involved in cell wall biosynthesis